MVAPRAMAETCLLQKRSVRYRCRVSAFFQFRLLPSWKLLDVSEVDGLSHTDTDRLMLTYSYHSGLAELRNLLAVPFAVQSSAFFFLCHGGGLLWECPLGCMICRLN